MCNLVLCAGASQRSSVFLWPRSQGADVDSGPGISHQGVSHLCRGWFPSNSYVLKEYRLYLDTIEVTRVCCVSGDDDNSGHTCSCHCHGEWCRHSGRLPACCQLRHCRGDRKVHLRHTRCQRWSVLLNASGGHWQGRTKEGKRPVAGGLQKKVLTI